MKRINQAFLVALIALFILTAFTIPSVSAYGSQNIDLRVRILRAYADDLDSDDLYDDTAVITIVLCKPKVSYKIYFVIATPEPEGNTIVTPTYEVYTRRRISINEFALCDTVSVKGWYTITAYVTCQDETAVSQVYSYDPGGGSQGPPC